MLFTKEHLFFYIYLDSAWVQHNANTSAHSFGWQVFVKLGTDSSRVAMWSGNLSPDDAEFAVFALSSRNRLLPVEKEENNLKALAHNETLLLNLNLRFGLVDECNTLA